MSHPDATAGPMARTPRDVAMLLQTMVNDHSVFDSRAILNITRQPQNRIRVGWLGDWDDDWSTQSANQVTAGKVQDVVSLFPFEDLWDAYNSVRMASTLEKYVDDFDVDELIEQRGTLIKEELAWELQQGKEVTQENLTRARDIHESFTDSWLGRVLNEFDVLALPSAQVWPFSVECRYPEMIGDTKMDTYHRWMQVCVPVSFAGLPCVTIPAGFSEEGLPMGIQLFAGRGDDLKVLNFANDYYDVSGQFLPQVVDAKSEDAVLKISII
ncbi:MAG: hypothetical protein SGARI_007161 [Bacillariaceae sp.]